MGTNKSRMRHQLLAIFRKCSLAVLPSLLQITQPPTGNTSQWTDGMVIKKNVLPDRRQHNFSCNNATSCRVALSTYLIPS